MHPKVPGKTEVNINIRIFLCLLVSIITLPPAFSQLNNKIVDHLTTESGLSSNSVTGIVKDSTGFIWIATSLGLDRFDGTTVKHYAHPKIPNARDVVMDHLNNIWLATDHGVIKFNTATLDFKTINPPAGTNETSASQLMIAKDSAIIALYPNIPLVAVFDPGNDSIRDIYKLSTPQLPDSPFSVDIQCIDQQNRLWVIINKNIASIDLKEENNERALSIPFDKKSLKESSKGFDAHPKVVFEDQTGNIYICNHGLKKMINNHGRDELQNIDIFNQSNPDFDIDFLIYSIDQDPQGRLWIATEKHGVIIYNPKNELVSSLDTKVTGTSILKVEAQKNGVWIYSGTNRFFYKEYGNSEIYHFSKSLLNKIPASTQASNNLVLNFNTNLYWINTGNKGVLYFNADNKRFKHIDASNPKDKDVNAHSIWGILEDHQKRIWFGTFGLNLYIPGKNQMRHFSSANNKNLAYLSGPVFGICEVKPNEFFVSSKGRVNWYTYKNEKLIKKRDFIPDPDNSNSMVCWSPHFLLKDHDGYIWMGRNGLSRYQLPDKKNPDGVFKTYFPGEKITNVYEDTQNRLWVLFNSKIGFFNPGRDSFRSVKLKTNKDTLETFNPKYICEWPENNFWIATEGQGLIKYNLSSDKCSVFTTRDGLPSNHLYAVYRDRNSNLWLSSNKGIVRYDLSDSIFNLFTESDGLQGNDFMAQAHHQGTYSGKLLFAGSNGMNIFNPDSIKIRHDGPRLAFTSLKVFNQEVMPGREFEGSRLLNHCINKTNTLEIPYDLNNFSISFSALDYSAPKKIRYAYWLEGLNDRKTKVGSENATAYFSGLAPGSYKLHVRSSNQDGLWLFGPNKKSNERILNISILPPWWQSKVAFVFYFLAISAITFLIRWTIIRQNKLRHAVELEKVKNEKNQEIQRIKTEFFMNISHEFRTPLTLILGPVEKLMNDLKTTPNNKNQLALIQRNATKLSRLINQLLDFRKAETGKFKLELSKGQIIQFVKQIFHEFHYLAEKHNIQYHFSTEPDIPDLLSCYFDPDILEKTLYNILSNAFKNTPDHGIIEINIDRHSKFLIIRIADTGIGIPKDKISSIFDRFEQVQNSNFRKQAGSGIGLSLTKNLIEIHKGSIDVKSQPGEGTEFMIQIPLELIPEKINEMSPEKASSSDSNPYLPMPGQDSVERNQEFTFNQPGPNPAENLMLVIDDNPDILTYISSEFKDHFHILKALNGHQGLDLAKTYVPDIIISDVMMPQMDGIEFSKKIKSDPATNHIPVILLTAKSTEENQLEGLETGIEDYLIKPFSAEILKTKVKNIIETRKLLRSKFALAFTVDESRQNIPSKAGKDFIEKAIRLLTNRMADFNYTGDDLAQDIGLSRSQLYRKIKNITGMSLNEFINDLRLKKAAEIIQEEDLTIKELFVKVGFSDRVYFSRMFKKKFNMTPTDFKKKFSH